MPSRLFSSRPKHYLAQYTQREGLSLIV